MSNSSLTNNKFCDRGHASVANSEFDQTQQLEKNSNEHIFFQNELNSKLDRIIKQLETNNQIKEQIDEICKMIFFIYLFVLIICVFKL